MSAKTNSGSTVISEWQANLNETFQLWTCWKWFSVELQDSSTPVSAMVSDFGWEPLQTGRLHGRLNMVFCITRGKLNSFRSAIQYHVTSRQLEVIPSNSSVFSRL